MGREDRVLTTFNKELMTSDKVLVSPFISGRFFNSSCDICCGMR